MISQRFNSKIKAYEGKKAAGKEKKWEIGFISAV